MFRIMNLLILFAFISCARTLEKDYKVVDASKNETPEWVMDLDEWLDDEEDEEEFKKHRYYFYTTEPKISQSISCELAKAKALNSAASEISTFIKNSLAQSVHGDPTKTDQKLSEYVQNDLYKEVNATIVGAQIYKTYWEKRRFDKEKGAAKNWDGYVCSTLVKLSKKQLKIAFARVQKSLENKASNSAKDNVKKIMDDSSKKYLD